MKRRSSNCLRVSMARSLPVFRRNLPKTNHERTLYVPYVFRNHLICREQVERLLKGGLKLKDRASAAGPGSWRVRFTNNKTIGFGEGRDHGGILGRKWARDQDSIGGACE